MNRLQLLVRIDLLSVDGRRLACSGKGSPKGGERQAARIAALALENRPNIDCHTAKGSGDRPSNIVCCR